MYIYTHVYIYRQAGGLQHRGVCGDADADDGRVRRHLRRQHGRARGVRALLHPSSRAPASGGTFCVWVCMCICAYTYVCARHRYVLFFIVCAFIWGDFLAAVDEIHLALGNKHRADFAAVQGTLEFLVEVECPWTLRVQILQFTRFVLQHTRENLHKKAIIDALPGNLQRGLVKHLYAHELAHVPIFQHLESVGDDNAAHDAVRASSCLHHR